MIKVFLREKKLKKGKLGLYLDFYPPIINPETNKQTRREHLRLYIYEKPKGEIERDHNKETKILGENIRARRQLELQSGAYGFVASQNKRKDFIKYFRSICDSKKNNSRSNINFWNSFYNHLKSFAGESVKFGDVTEQFCRDFREYLLYKSGLAQNTASGYFGNFKTVVKKAFELRLLPENPAKKVKGIELKETQRGFLSLEELKRLASVEFEPSVLQRASVFSCLTGLAFSDVRKLTWGEIQHSDSEGFIIRFRRKKTGRPQTHPISDEAAEILGDRGEFDELPFSGLMPWHCVHFLPKLITAAGIDRAVTFHCFRHTYATLQLTLGTDIYTVSKMLGHRKIETTQIYAKVIDVKKREAANKITLK